MSKSKVDSNYFREYLKEHESRMHPRAIRFHCMLEEIFDEGYQQAVKDLALTEEERKTIDWLSSYLKAHHRFESDWEYRLQYLESLKKKVLGEEREPPINEFGKNGVRDPENPCGVFVAGKPSQDGTCMGDGHYLCQECEEYKPEKEVEGE